MGEGARVRGDSEDERTAKGEWNARVGRGAGALVRGLRDAAERERVCLERLRRTEDMVVRMGVRVESTAGRVVVVVRDARGGI